MEKNMQEYKMAEKFVKGFKKGEPIEINFNTLEWIKSKTLASNILMCAKKKGSTFNLSKLSVLDRRALLNAEPNFLEYLDEEDKTLSLCKLALRKGVSLLYCNVEHIDKLYEYAFKYNKESIVNIPKSYQTKEMIDTLFNDNILDQYIDVINTNLMSDEQKILLTIKTGTVANWLKDNIPFEYRSKDMIGSNKIHASKINGRWYITATSTDDVLFNNLLINEAFEYIDNLPEKKNIFKINGLLMKQFITSLE